MAASTITRSTWTDDDGTGLTGTIINNARLQEVFDKIDALLAGTGSYVTLGLGGAMELTGRATPGVSASGSGRLYFDSTLSQFQISENTGAFKSLGAILAYAPTLGNSNGTTETDIFHFDVPANMWADGEAIICVVSAATKNDSGASRTMTFKVNVGAGAQVTIGTPTIAVSATEYPVTNSFTLIRVGSTVRVFDGLPGAFSGNPITAKAAAGTSTPTNFTTAFTVTLKVTLDAIDATYYHKVSSGGQGLVSHFKK